MNILVVGASGFVGSSLVDFISKKGINCYGLSRNLGLIKKEVLERKNFKFIQFDLNDIEKNIPDELNMKFDVVYYAASLQPNPSKEWYEYYNTNAKLMLNLYKLVNSEIFIFVSTASVYGNYDGIISESSPVNPLDYYGLSKYIGEKLIELEFNKKSKRVKTIIVRFHSMAGKDAGDSLVKTFYDRLSKNLDLELYNHGKLLRNIIHIDDVVEILHRIPINEHKFSDFDIIVAGSKTSASMLEIANLIKNSIGSKSKIILSDKSGRYTKDIVMNISKLVNYLDFIPMSTTQAVEKYIDDMRGSYEY